MQPTPTNEGHNMTTNVTVSNERTQYRLIGDAVLESDGRTKRDNNYMPVYAYTCTVSRMSTDGVMGLPDTVEIEPAVGLPANLSNISSTDGLRIMTNAHYERASEQNVNREVETTKSIIRVSLIDCLRERGSDLNAINEILRAIGMKETSDKWDVTVEYEGEEMTVYGVVADTEEDAVEKVTENLTANVAVNITCSLAESEDEIDSEDSWNTDWVLDQVHVTACESDES